MKGTLDYMPPEVLKVEHLYDKKINDVIKYEGKKFKTGDIY